MKRISLLCIVFLLMASASFAIDRDVKSYNVTDDAVQNVHYGAPINVGKAKQDTVIVYGGPGTNLGHFEDLGGAPSFAGWTSMDNTQKLASKWHVDTFHCDMIGGLGAGNHAWWCGEYYAEGCAPTDSILGGYGNAYLERLDWTGTVASGAVATNVQITFDFTYDSEPGYDGTTLQYRDATGMVDLDYWDGADTALANVYNFTMNPGDYGGTGGDEVLLRFEFESDGAWSDADCLWPTSGGVQIDDIAVYFDGAIQGTVEDCEVIEQWFTTLPPGVGDFAKAWPALDEIDPCRSNGTPVVAFIDDGEVVPGTGGYLCETWCYGPGGYVVNPEGGLAGPDFHLDNFIFSPVIAWPAGPYDGATLEFNAYRHFHPSFDGYNGLFYIWGVRSTLDAAGLTGWTDWRDRNFVYYGGADWIRSNFPVSDLLETGRLNVQLQLGAFELGWVWGWYGTDSAPAPYFDDCKFTAYTFGGPAMSSREIELLQDSFPAIGIIDYADLGANDIRVDAAISISPSADLRNDPGDSVVITLAAVRTGSVLNGMPRLYYNMKTNPVFDPYRMTGFTAQGYVVGEYVYSATGTQIADKFHFQLPDNDWFFPGDVFHYYMWAQDDAGGDIGTTLMPADTTGFETFGNMAYNSSFTVRGLPTIFDDGTKALVTPPILFWNDFSNRGAENEWYFALNNLGYVLGVDYDIYYTNGPASGVGSGLGGRATFPQLSGYTTMLYEAGNLAAFTITNVDYDNDPGDDVGVVDGWLRLTNKKMAMFGDDIVFDMVGMPQANAFISNWMGLGLDDRDLNPLIGNQATPTVQADVGNGVFNVNTEWVAYGGCLGFNTFDAVTPTTGTRLAHFLSPAGTDDYGYSAATLAFDATNNANVIHVPYGFHYIYTPGKAPVPSATRTGVLEEILLFFGEIPAIPDPSGLPTVVKAQLKSYPNPFNPKTTISYTRAAAGPLTMKVYNIRGELVKTLIDNEQMDASGTIEWNGTDNGNARVASGVYVVKGTAENYNMTTKLAVVK